ncbi:MAG TPA: circadian clock KaiB family protein [Syntrophorhabdaceae bacterium]|nr:circadian clock KaiB family protein [Syntrophorhabdaceae bacterium]
MNKKPRSKVGRARETSEQAAKKPVQAKYVLRLYIAGVSLRSSHALENIKKICEEHLKGRYELEVVDIYQHPDLVKGEQVVAVPTLIKELPPPLRKFIGDLTDTEKLLVGLELETKPTKSSRRP